MSSFGAQRIEHLRSLFDEAMRNPTGVQTDARLFELTQKLRTEAYCLITAGTLDIDFLAFLGREKAAGRTYSSQAHAMQVFSQAGVVAPPESPTDRISPVTREEAKHGL